jgi:hypothetical protein
MNDKQISNALAKIHKSRGDLARVKTVNVVKNRWLPSLRSAAINILTQLMTSHVVLNQQFIFCTFLRITSEPDEIE